MMRIGAARAAGLAAHLAVCLLAAAAGSPVHAEANYPTRPVQMIVPFPPGGNTDILTRIMADQYSATMSQKARKTWAFLV